MMFKAVYGWPRRNAQENLDSGLITHENAFSNRERQGHGRRK